MTPEAVLRSGWRLEGTVQPLGAGIINDTFLVKNIHEVRESASETDRFAVSAGESPWDGRKPLVLQRINQSVFRDPDLLMENVARATVHLCAKQQAWTPSLVPTTAGDTHIRSSGEVWRLCTYLSAGGALHAVETDTQAHIVGAGFGRTYRWLQDLPGPRLKDVIPGFLQLDHYLDAFDRRRSAPRELSAAIDKRRSLAARFRERTGYIHGDCRVEHLMLSNTGEAIGVLDLDTVMWGNWAWEFGDLVRSMSGDQLVPSRFEAAARGYLTEARIATTAEDLVLAPRYTTFMLGVRFLADHLGGDRYFKTSRPGENLERARAQFRLLEAIEAMESEMLRRARSAVDALAD